MEPMPSVHVRPCPGLPVPQYSQAEILFRNQQLVYLASVHLFSWEKECTPTKPTRIQRPHIKHIDPLHLPQYLQPLQPRRLVQIRGNSAWFCAWR